GRGAEGAHAGELYDCEPADSGPDQSGPGCRKHCVVQAAYQPVPVRLFVGGQYGRNCGRVHEMKTGPFLRNAFNYDTDEASWRGGLECDPLEDRTQQQFKEECDINTIVRNFGVTGEMPQTTAAPMQGDFTEVTDYQSAMQLIR